jgi:hypothetical protein
VSNGNNLDWSVLGSIDNEVGTYRPEKQRALLNQIFSLMSHGGHLCESVEHLEERFHKAIGGGDIVFGNIVPNINSCALFATLFRSFPKLCAQVLGVYCLTTVKASQTAVDLRAKLGELSAPSLLVFLQKP